MLAGVVLRLPERLKRFICYGNPHLGVSRDTPVFCMREGPSWETLVWRGHVALRVRCMFENGKRQRITLRLGAVLLFV